MKRVNNRRCTPNQIKLFLCFHCGEQFAANTDYQRHLVQDHQAVAICYQVFHAEFTREKRAKKHAEKRMRARLEAGRDRPPSTDTADLSPFTGNIITLSSEMAEEKPHESASPTPMVSTSLYENVEVKQESPEMMCQSAADLERQSRERRRREHRRTQDRIRRARKVQERRERRAMMEQEQSAPSIPTGVLPSTSYAAENTIVFTMESDNKDEIKTIEKLPSQTTPVEAVPMEVSPDRMQVELIPVNLMENKDDIQGISGFQQEDLVDFIIDSGEIACEFCASEEIEVQTFLSTPELINHWVHNHGASILSLTVYIYKGEELLTSKDSKAGQDCPACGIEFNFATEYYNHLILEHATQLVSNMRKLHLSMDRFRVGLSILYRNRTPFTVSVSGVLQIRG